MDFTPLEELVLLGMFVLGVGALLWLMTYLEATLDRPVDSSRPSAITRAWASLNRRLDRGARRSSRSRRANAERLARRRAR